MFRIVPLLFLVALGCASSSRPKGVEAPDMSATLAHPLYFGSGPSAPVTIDVAVRNNASVPIIVRSIETDSPGMLSYALVRARRTMSETIAPGQTKRLSINTQALRRSNRPNEPLTIRTVVEFEAGGRHWREMIMERRADVLQ